MDFLFLFEGYKFPLQTLADKSQKDIRAHYQAFAERLGVYMPPPGKLLHSVGGFVQHSENDPEKAIELFLLNAEYHPDAWIAHQDLAMAYEAQGEVELAIQAYERALDLNPGNEGLRARLEALQSN